MKIIFNILSVVLLSSTGIKAFLATQVMCESKTTTTTKQKCHNGFRKHNEIQPALLLSLSLTPFLSPRY